MRNQRIKLLVIPEPDPMERSILEVDWERDAPSVPLLRGQESDVPPMVCGECERVLVVGYSRGKVNAVVLRCPACGAYNDTP